MAIARSPAARQYLIWGTALSLAALVTMPLLTSRLRKRKTKKDAATLNSMPALPLFHRARQYTQNLPDKAAVFDTTKGEQFTYGQLLQDAAALKQKILKNLGLTEKGDLEERRIAFLAPNGYDYVVIQWAVWAAGGVCVPLCRLTDAR